MTVQVKIVEDSVSPDGIRLTSVEVITHRFTLAEWNTHRVFSRNSASSRAIPLETMLKRVWDDPAWPLVWPCEQPGMSGGAELSDEDRGLAWELFQNVHLDTYNRITEYMALIEQRYPGDPKAHRLHKSLVNRLIEPFMFHTMLISSTEWNNFYRQRCSPSAMPEFRIVAEMVRDVLDASEPNELDWYQWHTPYIGVNTDDRDLSLIERLKVSVGRCARTSYLTHDGLRDPQKDIELYEGTLAKYGHWSPLEHVAVCLPTTPNGWSVDPLAKHRGNFDQPWFQMRQFVEAQDGSDSTIEEIVKIKR
jgi:hypothetical protein